MSKFRLMLKPSVQEWKPTQTFADKRPEPEPTAEPQPSSSSSSKPLLAPGRCHAFLEAFNRTPVKVNTHANVGNYAVIGRGFAATVNLATLRSEWGRKRVHRGDKSRHLVVVGYPDPWQTYVRHNMNQEIELLTLPGYLHRPELPDWSERERWLDSRRFAAVNEAEMNRHLGEPDSRGDSRVTFFRDHVLLHAGVARIERVASKRTGKDRRFKLHFNRPDLPPLIASKVDICSGTGQQTHAATPSDDKVRGIKMPEVLWREYLDANASDTPRRVYSAEMYVAGPAQYVLGGSVLIASAASPAGIQAGEHALQLDSEGLERGGGTGAAEVVLLASATMNDGFPPIGRLDGMARTAEGPLPMRLKTDPKAKLFPTDPRIWFGESYRIVSIEVVGSEHVGAFCHVVGDPAADAAPAQGADLTSTDHGKLLVTLKTDRDTRLVHGRSEAVGETEAPLVYGLFDQVVFNTGRNRGGRTPNQPVAEDGSAMQLVSSFIGDLSPINAPGYEFPVGLHTGDQRLRILGAAGINNPIYKGDGNAKQFERYEDSIPWQARVAGEGVTLAAVTIAIANRYFELDKGKCNPCINTATLPELKLLLGNAEAARQVYGTRRWRVRPFMATPQEVLLAAEYWSYYFDRDDFDTLLSERANSRTPEFDRAITSIRYMVGKINNLGFLRTDWDREKKHLAFLDIRTVNPPLADPSVLANAVVRYADQIIDPDTRVKVPAGTA